MNRNHKKCLIASTGVHAFLLLLLVVGSAFLVPAQKPIQNLPRLRVVPTKLIDEALSGGGGNPNIAPTEAVQKGETLNPTPPAPAPKTEIPPPKIQPPAPAPEPTPEPDAPVAKAPTRSPPKSVVQPAAKDLPPKTKPKREPKPLPEPKLTSKPNPRAVAKETAPLDLKPVTRKDTDRQKEEAEAQAKAEAHARADEARVRGEEARARGVANQKAAKLLGAAIASLKEGFNTGTAVETSGPGGEAYAGYDQFVKEAYDNAWLVTQDLTDENSTARVSVTIRNTGHVVDAKILNRSGNTALDRSVERTLRNVKFIAPFPEGAKDKQRTFIINFNLKAKRLTG